MRRGKTVFQWERKSGRAQQEFEPKQGCVVWETSALAGLAAVLLLLPTGHPGESLDLRGASQLQLARIRNVCAERGVDLDRWCLRNHFPLPVSTWTVRHNLCVQTCSTAEVCAGGGEERVCSLLFVWSHPMETQQLWLQMWGVICLALFLLWECPLLLLTVRDLFGALTEHFTHSDLPFP